MSAQRGHENRDDLAGEHPFGDMGQLILFVVFLVVWVSDSFVLHISVFLGRYVSLLLRIPVGVAFIGAAAYLAREGVRIVFGEVRADPSVITAGVFGRIRHPVYLGCILFYVGLVVFTLSVLSAIICAIIIVFYHYISKHEERLLLDRFGKDYEQYMRSVPMWIPRI